MVKLSFSAQVAAFAEKIPGAVEAVFKESVQELVAEMQTPIGQGGRMRVDTGFLRASLMASTAAMPAISPNRKPVDGQSYGYDAGQIEAVILGSDINDTLFFGYSAAYAGHREYGSNGQTPDAFVRSAAQRWDSIVEMKARELKSRLGL
ncbi:hypothetical protein [Phyllobacterium endophyticum]|uniref:HK97 gp10 family phage protein n=1 Tax=Phyllobacterium endophyticum TaxID=1149773 RepID=A0A2P7AUQ7_9HYPH|nr:hypothetical protein [Phyllobacterium endophyticum]MBB3234439.1 hypothetical protein [Phyllobacterium endophyticum]PSH57948.1 hypothetical protein CU100_09715 [Phyllobacterium endophyticum]TYR44156.1 HK97 gp10 family phage protein [Phyllobacterium endophyticum]